MIRANELRIGNWFIGYDNKPFQFDYTDFMIIGTPAQWEQEPFEPDELIKSPIKLSEELLLKCGFVCFAESEVSKGFSIGTNPVTNDHMVTLTWLKDIFKNNLDNYPFFKNGHHVIKHLHQLQNLYFALTGQELEVKL